MSLIAGTCCALPVHRHRQSDLAEMTADLCAVGHIQRSLITRLYANAGVDTRHTVLPLSGYGELNGLGPTNDLYIDHATALGEEAVSGALAAAGVRANEVDLLVVTSVTGVAVPSLDARLIPLLGLRSSVKRLPMFGLGCVAGAAGLGRVHDYLLAWPEQTAVLLAVELCSLSFPRTRPTTADLVVSGLFGDGAVAVVVRGEHADQKTPNPSPSARATPGPQILATHSEICPDSCDVLGWRLGAEGFRIILTTELSDIVAKYLSSCVRDFLAEHALTVDDITSWVCHPGGPNVIDAVQRSLFLSDDSLEMTRRSLAQVGNMSSASVLHVLKETAEHQRPPAGSLGLMIGLGPGVSIELILLRW
jgi:alkylresorcinol/alkylpyrone synthase